ncbi:MAG: zf-HC2 domain-containing protein [Deltaproteobacteria bacterium]|nr:zf-HC2 domain-containing protein [Deltaproteobacteria bacterium]
MNKYCKNIEARIVDCLDGELNLKERQLFLAHINECSVCKKKYEEFLSAQEHLKPFLNRKEIVENNARNLYSTIMENRHKGKKYTKLVIAAVSLALLIVLMSVYSIISFDKKLQRAREMEISVDYFVDIEEELINSDEHTFKIYYTVLYGHEFKDFEEILKESSIVRP